MCINDKILRESIKDAKNNLNSLILKLNSFKFPNQVKIEFNTSELSKDGIDKIVKNVPVGSDSENENFIYIIKVDSDSFNAGEIKNLLRSEKNKQIDEKTKDLPQISITNNSEYLYVGRSHKLRSRIRQHLGEKYPGTYALHLERWCKNLNYDIVVIYFLFKENQDNAFIQAIEDALWDKLKPCFGRKGDK